MGEINFTQYSSAFPRFFPSLGFHPMGENAKSRERPWLLVETANFTPLSVDSGYLLTIPTMFTVSSWRPHPLLIRDVLERFGKPE
jgi:hypothetical protein